MRTPYKNLKTVLKSYERGYPIQQKQLQEILSFSTKNSDFYKAYAGKALREFPVTNKNILNSNHSRVLIPANKIPGQAGIALYIQRTSGSTGAPFAIEQDVGKRNRRVAELKYFNQLIGFRSHERLGQCRIWTKWHSKGKWQSFCENITPINISKMDEETTKNLVQTIYKKKISALRAYASWYDSLVNYLEVNPNECNKLRSLKVCISISEALNEETREKMKKMTGVRIVECYASEETGMLGQQTLTDTAYYLNHAGYVFECLKLDSDEPAEYGELGRIVVTDLYNYAFPLIRYDTGDTAIFAKENDTSRGWPYISKLYGRRMDLVFDTQGRPLHPMNFARVLKNIPDVIQWQFVQKNEKEYLVRLNMKAQASTDGTLKEIKSILGSDSNVVVELVDDIPVLASGKRKPVVNEWKN